MSVPTSSASTPATPAPVLCQAPINVPLPIYDWNAPDQMCKFRLFKCQLDTWFQLCKIKAEEHLDYLLCILGKADKCDPEKFLNYLKNTLDEKISPKSKYMSLRISRRGLMNQSTNS